MAEEGVEEPDGVRAREDSRQVSRPLTPGVEERERKISGVGVSRRQSMGVPISFPEVDAEEAKLFVQQGSILRDCSSRSSACGLLPGRRVSAHYNVDESWQFLQWSATPSQPSTARGKWHLSDISDVYPLVLDDEPLRVKHKHMHLRRHSKGNLQFEAVYGRRRVKFRAATRQEAKLWVTALQCHLANRSKRTTIAALAEMAQNHFLKADVNDDGGLEFSEVKALLQRLNLRPSNEYLSELFQTFDKDNNLNISEDEFKELFGKMMEKASLSRFFTQYSSTDSNGEKVMSCQDLRRFLKEVQGEPRHTDTTVREAFLAGLSEPLVAPGGNALTTSGFSSIMCSGKNSIFEPRRSRLYQDMTKPLSHYWINCSHNTYLEGAQIAGSASVSQYLEVLSSGCRCVEIDLWDGPNGEPIVTHGYTLSSKISFQEVCRALQDHAFNHSEFPLILSLENHCSDDQVVQAGIILSETFGGRLLRHPISGFEGEPLVSPAQAKRRVLVKGSLVKVPEENEGNEGFETTDVRTSTSFSMFARGKNSMSHAAGLREFNSLIYLVARKCHSLKEDRQPCNISSFSESRAVKHIRKHGPELNSYHRNNLSRIYPPGHNVCSSNLAPLVHWIHGAQLVALNFQVTDTSVLLNEGIFREENGGFGYVLKPPSVMDPETAELDELRLNLTVLSAHFLPRPDGMEDDHSLITSPLVVVSLHEPYEEPLQHETAVKEDGFAPTWDESFELLVTRKDASILTFEVYHQGAQRRYFMAAAAYPVSGLRQGVRWVPLWDHTRRQVPNCGMLVRLQMEKQPGLGPSRSSTGVDPTRSHRSSAALSARDPSARAYTEPSARAYSSVLSRIPTDLSARASADGIASGAPMETLDSSSTTSSTEGGGLFDRSERRRIVVSI